MRTTQRSPPPYSVYSSRWPSWKNWPIRSETRVMGHTLARHGGACAWSSPRRGRGECARAGARGWARIMAWNGTRAPRRGCCSWRASSLVVYVSGAAALAHRPRDRERRPPGSRPPGSGVARGPRWRRGRRWPADAGRAHGRLRAGQRHRRTGRSVLSTLLGLADSVEVALVGWLLVRVPRAPAARRQRRLAALRDRDRGCGRRRGARRARSYAALLDASFRHHARPGRALPRRLGAAARTAGAARATGPWSRAWAHAASSSSRSA